jgi:hypothetical protein
VTNCLPAMKGKAVTVLQAIRVPLANCKKRRLHKNAIPVRRPQRRPPKPCITVQVSRQGPPKIHWPKAAPVDAPLEKTRPWRGLMEFGQGPRQGQSRSGLELRIRTSLCPALTTLPKTVVAIVVRQRRGKTFWRGVLNSLENSGTRGVALDDCW